MVRPVVWAVAAVVTAVGAAAGAAFGDEVPAPRFDRVDYKKPETCLALDPKAGSERAIRAIAEGLKRKTPEETLAAVDRWMARTLAWEEERFDEWRTVEQEVADGTYGGCADHAMVYGTMLRACGIPTAWVKTMDFSWIERFRSGKFDPNRDAWSGHVFLEVHVGGAWRLLDAQGRRLYMRYDPTARVFPDGKLAYDKGGKPWDLLLSVRWEDWKKQTAAYFQDTDPTKLVAPGESGSPKWGEARPVSPLVCVAGGSPRYLWVREVVGAEGYESGPAFNDEFDKYLPTARGQVLVVTCKWRDPVFPKDRRDEFLPKGWNQATARGAGGPGWTQRVLADGTRVVFVAAEGRHPFEKALKEALPP
jgi:hypothetical protein